jgi:hypothetical protein
VKLKLSLEGDSRRIFRAWSVSDAVGYRLKLTVHYTGTRRGQSTGVASTGSVWYTHREYKRAHIESMVDWGSIPRWCICGSQRCFFNCSFFSFSLLCRGRQEAEAWMLKLDRGDGKRGFRAR